MRPALALVPLLVVLAAAPRSARADESGKPIQLGLWDPVQIVPRDQGVSGFGFNLIYGKNAFMNGFEMGFVNVISGSVTGVQWSFVSIVDGDFSGWQWSTVSLTGRHFEGLQMGLYNSAESAQGLQFGLINHAGTLKGLQLGLVNIIEKGGMLPVCIIFNASF